MKNQRRKNDPKNKVIYRKGGTVITEQEYMNASPELPPELNTMVYRRRFLSLEGLCSLVMGTIIAHKDVTNQYRERER